MPRITLDLNNDEGRTAVKGTWRLGIGLVPGEQNQGLVAEIKELPARLKDFDDSSWPETANIRTGLSSGLTFAWFRLVAEMPTSINGVDVAGMRVLFETNTDNYGELWIDGQIDPAYGVIVGNNVARRVEVSRAAVPGARHTIAVLIANGPLGEPRGGIYMRHATLAFESAG